MTIPSQVIEHLDPPELAYISPISRRHLAYVSQVIEHLDPPELATLGAALLGPAGEI